MKTLKVLGIIFGVIVLLVVGALGYLGYIGPVADILGVNKSRDLGVKYTDADLSSAKDKFKVELATVPSSDPKSSIRYEGSREVNESFTDEELTAMIASKKYIYNPVSNVQIKIGNAGQLEASGLLNVGRLPNYFSAVAGTSVSSEDVKKATNLLPATVPFYLSGTASVTNGAVSVDIKNIDLRSRSLGDLFVNTALANSANANISSFSVGRFNISSAILASYKEKVNSFLTTRLNNIQGLKAKSVTFDEGEMNFSGSMPTKKYRTIE